MPLIFDVVPDAQPADPGPARPPAAVAVVAAPQTLADVVARLAQDPTLDPTRRRDLVSAVERVAALIGKPTASLPADLNALRPRVTAIRPALHQISPKTWSNLKANFKAAVLMAGGRLHSRVERAPEWQALSDRLPDRRMRNGLSRLITWCSGQGIAPAQVDDAVMVRFHAWVRDETIGVDPNDCHRRSARLWNAAVTDIPGWPQRQVAMPDYRTHTKLREQDLPASFGADLQSYLDWAAGDDPLAEPAPSKALAPRTLRLHRTQLLLAASRLVASGVDPTTLTGLAALVEAAAVKTVLRSYLTPGTKPSAFVQGLAITLVSVAAHWVRVPGADLTVLRAIKRKLGTTAVTMTDKNRTALRQFDDPAVLQRLLALPEQLAETAGRMKSRPRAAVTMQIAIAITLLLHAPMRMANLHALRLDRHLGRPGGPKRPWLISIPAEESKNGERLDYELDGTAADLLQRYVRRFRPELSVADCPFLFPGEDGLGCKDQGTLSQQIVKAVETWVGVRITPHQFRHLAAGILLRAAPGAFSAVQQLLGHKHQKTTTGYYTKIDTLTAGREYDRILQASRATPPRRRR